MSTLALDVDAVRARFSALQVPTAFFDGPGGTQCPDSVIDAVASYLRESNANVGGHFGNSRRSDALLAQARLTAAAFLRCEPEEAIFGQNMTTLNFTLSRTVGRTLAAGDEILVTRLDHDGNVSPWLELAHDLDLAVGFVDVHDDTTLDLDDLERQLTDRTRVVAFPLASNATGTLTDARRIVELAHDAGALAWADAVHYAPHSPIDAAALGIDVLICSPYKFFGPHLGVLWGRLAVLSTLPAEHVRPSGDEPPDSWETGTQSHEALSALLGTMDYLCSLAPEGNRRERLHAALTAIRAYERTLSERLISGMLSVPGLRIFGITDPARFDQRVPTISFVIDGQIPSDLSRRLGERGVCSWAGNHYALEPMGRLGLGGTNRIGLVHYNTPEEIDHFVETLRALAG
jgi:cysteine desulfurase family protein (TIGR01976 family)